MSEQTDTARAAPRWMAAGVHACPRCRGPLLREQDSFGSYQSCLLCGYVAEQGALPPPPAGQHPPHRARRL